jgi:hypothetical protein
MKMTDKKTKNAGVVLSNTGLTCLIETLKKQASESVDHCRRLQSEHYRDQFKDTYDDLLNALNVYALRFPGLGDKDMSDGYDSRFYEIGKLVAFAERLGVKSSDAFKDLVRQKDTDAPLDFLLEMEVLRSKHPKLDIQVTLVSFDDEVPF